MVPINQFLNKMTIIQYKKRACTLLTLEQSILLRANEKQNPFYIRREPDSKEQGKLLTNQENGGA